MRNLVLICLLLVASALHAQLPEKGDYKTRLGLKNPDKAVKLLSEFFDKEKSPYFKVDKPVGLDFYRSFCELTDLAPYSDYVFYNGSLFEGDKSVFVRLLNGIQDPATKVVVVDNLLDYCHNFVDHLDSINVLRNNSVKNLTGPGDTISMPVAMTKYAHIYFSLAGNPKFYPEKMYDKVQARKNFRDAFQMLRSMNIDPGQVL